MQLIFSEELQEFFDFGRQYSIIAEILSERRQSQTTKFANFFSRNGEDITYLPTEKIEKVDHVWTQCRVRIKVGRFTRKILTELVIKNYNINDLEIERFVNLFKSYFTQDESKLIISSGEDIKKYYLQNNYHRANGDCVGTLWNSCMRQPERNKYLTLYSVNHEQCSLISYLDEEGKVRARALLWNEVFDHDNDQQTYKLMDRIYSVYDHDVEFLKKWASDNGYITKAYQNSKTETIYNINGEVKNLRLYVKLKKEFLTYVPYLDTFKYYNLRLGRYSSTPEFSYSYILVQSDGSYEREKEPDEFQDDEWN